MKNDAKKNPSIPDFQKSGGLIPAIVQDDSGQVLMLAWMNEESWAETRRTGYACYFSRSRQQLWRKGETSGHVQRVRAIHVDCDADCLLLTVEQTGVACHEGYRSCFFRRFENGSWTTGGSREVSPKAMDEPPPLQVSS